MKRISTTFLLVSISLLLLGSTAAHIPFQNTHHITSYQIPIHLQQNTLYVGGSGPQNYSSIQKAIDAAETGDTIYVYPRTYNEHLTLLKALTIIGEHANTTIVDGSSTGTLIQINASGVMLKNLRFQNAGGNQRDALITINQNSVNIQSSIFSHARTALLIQDVEDITINNCNFYHVAAGIRAQSSTNIHCRNCSFVKTGLGIIARQSNHFAVSRLRGSLNGVTIMIIQSHNVTIVDSVVCKSNENQGGIYAEFSHNILLENCSVYHNGFGIRLLNCTNALINKSEIYNCKLGIQISDSTQNTVIYSDIYKCDVGIYLDLSKQVTIHNNNIHTNYVGGIASEHSFADARHNWWGSPLGVLGNLFFLGGWVSVFPPLWSSIENGTYQQSTTVRIPVDIIEISAVVPSINNDTDGDGVPDWWEEQYGYDPYIWNNHPMLDPDEDGLNNVEEYLTYEWQSHPFKKDIFVEIDVMDASYKLDEQQKQKMINRFEEHNISLHIDDGNMGGGEVIEKHDYINYAVLSNLYWKYFLHNNPSYWRKGVFRYVILSDSLFKDYPGFVFIGWDEADSFALSVGYYKKHIPNLFREGVLARVFMHELGHTLGLFHDVFPGIDNQSCIFPFVKGRLIYRNYRSCMNYQYAWRILDYSDGSHGKNDFDDWSNIDLTFFQDSRFG